MEAKFKYERTVQIIEAIIPAGGQTSNEIDLGGMQARGVILPSNWTSGLLSFKASDVPAGSVGYQAYDIYNFDGTTMAVLKIPASVATAWVPLFAHWLDAVPYFKLFASVAQATESKVKVIVQPLYQGLHG